jgi:P27 family predicted phage terminase small subunit
MIAQAYDEITAFREQIAQDGLVVTGYNEQMVAHPLLKEIRAAQSVIVKALSTLGFSPTDRARLGIQEAQARSALLDLQARMGGGR